jgi:hypothetical protein
VIGSDCIDSQSIRSLPRIITITATGGIAKTLNNVVIRISTCCANTNKKNIAEIALNVVVNTITLPILRCQECKNIVNVNKN